MLVQDTLYVPDLEPRLKHPTVFKRFDALQSGESFLLVNDHDPIPLFYELKAERGDTFEWKKVENGPDVWQVEITKKAAACSIPLKKAEIGEEENGGVPVLNVTLLEPKQKHPTIFRQFDALAQGEAFQILNDHDPKPLYYQMIAERGNVFTWKYLKQGPEWWQVEIRKNEVGITVGELAAKDIRKAEVFKKWGIDFCCGGKKSLSQACEELGIDAAVVEAELTVAQNAEAKGVDNDFDRWQPDFLADYIYNQHHLYYYDEGPVISDLCDKVAARHGDHYPFLAEIKVLYKTLQSELNTHFIKEEKVLFPFIKELVKAKRSGDKTALQQFPSIQEPVHMMEADHEAAGDLLVQLRKRASNYVLPEGACNSFSLLYQKLQNLEEDLHQHIHLENNILFPKALRLEKELLH